MRYLKWTLGNKRIDPADNREETSAPPKKISTTRQGAKEPRCKPNENLARECLELHTMGVGSGYTQQDPTALAAILTGRSLIKNEYPWCDYKPQFHKPGCKDLFGPHHPRRLRRQRGGARTHCRASGDAPPPRDQAGTPLCRRCPSAAVRGPDCNRAAADRRRPQASNAGDFRSFRGPPRAALVSAASSLGHSVLD
jgi:hypothetical protein